MKQTEKTVKILILNPYLPTLGGGEKNMGFFCQFLEERYNQVQIDILVHNYNEVNIHSEDYVTIEDLNRKFGLRLRHTNILKVDLNPAKNLWQSLKNKRKIEKISKGYDLFINHMFLSKHAGLAKKNIYVCMFPPKRFVNEYPKGLRHLVAKLLDRYFYRSYDLYFSNSEFTNHWMSHFWRETKKNRIIYPPAFWEAEIPGRYNEEKKKNIIISVGRFFVAAHSKKQMEMVQMFISHPDVYKGYEYHLVGSVSNYPQDIDYLNKIKAIAQEAGNVFIHENCSYDELIELYSQAKLFWHATGYLVDENREPEKMEHFGITTVEAMSFGAVPVVISKGGQRETVVAEECGFLWNNEEECINSTQILIQDDSRRKQMAQKAVERSYRFSVDEFFRENGRIFDEQGL